MTVRKYYIQFVWNYFAYEEDAYQKVYKNVQNDAR